MVGPRGLGRPSARNAALSGVRFRCALCRQGRVDAGGGDSYILPGRPAQKQAAGIAFVPDHRMKDALMGGRALRENFAMVHPEHGSIGPGILALRRAEAGGGASGG